MQHSVLTLIVEDIGVSSINQKMFKEVIIILCNIIITGDPNQARKLLIIQPEAMN